MEEITINFGLVASEKFPAVARSRVLTRGTGNVHLGMELQAVAGAVLGELLEIGCTPFESVIRRSRTEPTLVVKLLYPVSDEKADCAPPSVLRYEKYMRLYEVACWAAQDCVAVYEHSTDTGLLVGANAKDWGEFDKTKFITIGE